MNSKVENKNETVRVDLEQETHNKLKLIIAFRGKRENINDIVRALAVNEIERLEREENGLRKFIEEDNQE